MCQICQSALRHQIYHVCIEQIAYFWLFKFCLLLFRVIFCPTIIRQCRSGSQEEPTVAATADNATVAQYLLRGLPNCCLYSVKYHRKYFTVVIIMDPSSPRHQCGN
jgi:hypothetical protein